MSKATDHAGRLSAVPLRLGDSAAAETIPDMLEATVDSYDATYGVAILTGPPQELPTGTPDATTVTKAWNKYGVDLAEDDIILAIHWEGAYDDTGSHATYGQIDWVILPTAAANPVRIVLIDGTSESQDPGDPINPITVNGNPTRIYSGTLSEEGDIWVRVNDHKRLGRLWQPKEGAFKALLSGKYDPNAVDPTNYPTSDERPLYSIDGESDGETIARVTTQASVADWSTPAEPDPSTDGRCTTYKVDETGATVEDDTDVEFSNYFKSAVTVDSIILLEEFQGQLVCAQVVTSSQLIAKLTATVPKRISDTYGTVGSVSLGHLVAGVWTELLTGQTVYNPALNPVHIPSGANIQIPVGDSNGHWVLQNPTDLQQVKNFSTANPQFIMHCASTTEYEWKDGDPILALQGVDSSTAGCVDLQLKRTCNTSWETWDTVMGCLECVEITYATSVACDEEEGLSYETETITVPACPDPE